MSHAEEGRQGGVIFLRDVSTFSRFCTSLSLGRASGCVFIAAADSYPGGGRSGGSASACELSQCAQGAGGGLRAARSSVLSKPDDGPAR